MSCYEITTSLDDDEKRLLTFRSEHHKKILHKEPSDLAILQHYIHRIEVRTTLCSITNHRKVLLSSFHLNGLTIRFHPETENFEPPCTATEK